MPRKAKARRGIHPRPDGRCLYQWYYRGRRHRVIAPNVTIAEANLAKVKSLIAEGRYLDKETLLDSPPFAEVVKKFLKWCKVNLRPDTLRGDERRAKAWLAFPAFQNRLASEITARDIEAFKAAEVERKRYGKPLSKATVDLGLARLARCFALAQEWGMVKENPVEKVKRFRVESRRDRFLSEEEEASILKAAPPILRPAIVFSLHTGLRLGELVSLIWRQVDRERALVTVTAEKAKGKRTRHIPVNQAAAGALDALPSALSKDALVFPMYSGDHHRLKKLWWGALKSAELEGSSICWHTLRHTFASRLVMAGADLVTVQRLLGHSSLTMVMRYAHLAPDHLRGAVNLLDLKYGTDRHKTATGPAGGSREP